jgi:hypothetical protein
VLDKTIVVDLIQKMPVCDANQCHIAEENVNETKVYTFGDNHGVARPGSRSL